MNNYTELTRMQVAIGETMQELMKAYVQYPRRRMQSEGYFGLITLTQYERFQHIREMPAMEGIKIQLLSRNQV